MEEIEVLKAIFEDDLTVLDGPELPLRLQCKVSANMSVEFLLSEDYPSVTPKVAIKGGTPRMCKELESLIAVCLESKEENYLYDAIESARTWSSHNNFEVENHVEAKPEMQKLCKFFIEGKCRFGNNCLHKHPGNVVKDAAPMPIDDRSNTAKAVERHCTDRRGEGEASNNHKEKKVSMKTAVDVISRILWDDELPTEHFIIGYLDRFIGIVEKPFSSFSWEDIASVDYSVLAIPKHRIQYFKYKDVIVWDKRTRLDKVFGSTGNGKHIYQVIQDSSNMEVGDADSGNGSCEGKEAAASIPHEEDSTSSEDDDDRDDNLQPVATHRRRNEKDRPNFFFCFKVADHAIRKKIFEVQQEIISCNSLLENSCLKQTELHVTLCMLKLQNKEEQERALRVLDSLQPLLVCMLPSFKQLLFQHLGNFHGRVLHVKVYENASLCKFVSILLLKLKDAGLHACGNREPYCPHVTIVKLSRPICRELHFERIDPNYYEHHAKSLFGKSGVQEIFLCSTSKQRDDSGFYVKLGSKINSLLCISDQLPNVISNHVIWLTEKSVFTEQKGDELVQALLSDDEVQFEKAVCHIESFLSKKPDVKLEERNVFILRGLQGSGKSHLISNCKEGKCYDGSEMAVCSADEYFEDKMPGYIFSASELASAHIKCQKKFVDAISKDLNTIVVDNTNSQALEYGIYERIAKLCGYSSHVLEMSCGDEETLKKFIARSQHKVDYDATLRTWKRWEPDENAVLLEPQFGHADEQISLLELCRRKQSRVNANRVLFSACYLDSASQQKLFEVYPALHSKVTGSHLTLAYKPLKEELPHIPVGKKHEVSVLGYICSDVMQAVAVKEIGEPCCRIEIPHITISHSKKAAPQHAKMALSNKSAWIAPPDGLVLSGTIGVQVDIGSKNSIAVTVPSQYHEICQQVLNANCKDQDRNQKKVPERDEDEERSCTQVDGSPELFIGPEVVESLFVFDFDGTLFETPGPVEGRKLYQELTGERWAHTSWIGRAESLQWPLRSYPGPSFMDFKGHLGRAQSLTVLLTGRLKRTVDGVLEVLREYGIHPERCYLKPDDGLDKASKAMAKVSSFKTDVVKGLLKEFPTVKCVKFWDDRQDNIGAFKRMKKEYKDIAFDIYHVAKVDRPKKAGFAQNIQGMVGDFGFGIDSTFEVVIEKGIKFIKDAWRTCLELDQRVDDEFLKVFGSFPLKRRSDVDLCFLAPDYLRQDECVLKLEAELIRRGVRYIHSATGIKCPRLKFRLCLRNFPPADFDIVFAPCLSAVHNTPSSLKELFINSGDDVKKPLEGVMFLERVITCIAGKISTAEFGRLVDVIVHYLKTKHLKGNAFHCVRTFHIVRALAEMFTKSSDSHSEFSELVRTSFEYLCTLDIQYWSRICKDTVPREFIEKTIDAFVLAVTLLNQSASCDTLFAVSKFPPPGHVVVSLEIRSHVSELRWRGYTIVEAKLGGYLRSLMAVGIEIEPGSCDGRGILIFAALETERTNSALQRMVLGLKAEPVFLHNKGDLDLILKAKHQQTVKSAVF